MKNLIAALVMLLLLPATAQAVLPDEVLQDPVLEKRARDISRTLRCLVCQGEAIDESSADLARDLRLLVRERLQAGDSDAAVLAFVRDRYGDYVLLNPPLRPATFLLWLAPFAALGAGGVIVLRRVRRHGQVR